MSKLQSVLFAILGFAILIAALVLVDRVQEHAMNMCLKTNSQNYCENFLGRD